MSFRHDRRRGSACRKPSDIDAPMIDGMLAHNLFRYSCDQRRLPIVAALIVRLEPVPALLGISGDRLLWISDKEPVLLGNRIHPRSRGEVVGALGASVQHDDQGKRSLFTAAGDVQLVASAAGSV